MSRSKRVISRRPNSKKDNSAHSVKRKLRERLVDALGVESPAVLDVFAGSGQMWRSAYGSTPHYLGLDQKQYDDERHTIVCDNSRFLRLAGFNLSRFDIFDIDAYGSPYYCLAIICRRFRWGNKRRIGIVLTDGDMGAQAARRGVPPKMLAYLGMDRFQRTNPDDRAQIIKRFIEQSCDEAGARPEHLEHAEMTKGARMKYIAYVMQRC